MSDVAKMVRLMEHAADLLEASQGQLDGCAMTGGHARAQRGALAAMSFAEAMLRLTAASVTEAEDTHPSTDGGQG